MRIMGWGRNGVRRGTLATLAAATTCLALAGSAQAAITISGPTPVNEGTASAALRYTVTRPGALLASTASVRFRITGGTASPGSDYTPLSPSARTLDMSTGALFVGAEQTVDVPVLNDTLYEGSTNETVIATIDMASGDTIDGDGTASGEIIDNDAKPKVTIANGSGAEGTAAAGAVGLPVTLSAVSGLASSVHYTITPGTATAGDITTTAGTLNIPAGQSGGTINVPTVPDALDEPDEQFTVTLDSPTQADLGTTTIGTGTVTNDDTPVASIAGVAANEGTGAAPTPFSFTVSLSNASARELSVRATTADAQAKAPGDYAAVDQVVTFAAGETSKTVTVNVVADAVDEPNEAFSISLSEPNGVTVGSPAIGGIIDDDLSSGTGTGTGTGTGSGGTGTGTTTITPITTPGGTGTASPTGSSTDRTPPLVTLAALKVKRPGSLTIRVTCPFTETRCTGTLTVFSLVVKKSKIKALRREIRVATGTYALSGGGTATVTMKLSAKAKAALKAAKKFKARAFGVTRDAAGNVGTGTLTATLKR